MYIASHANRNAFLNAFSRTAHYCKPINTLSPSYIDITSQGKESKTLVLQVTQLRAQLESERLEVKRLTSIVATLREEAESTKRYSDNLSREVRWFNA